MKLAMNKYCMSWIQEWCRANNWSEPFRQCDEYWAFPPQAVMPLPIPSQELQLIKAEKGASPAERLWFAMVWSVSAIALTTGVWLQNPMPMVFAFAFCAMVFAAMDEN